MSFLIQRAIYNISMKKKHAVEQYARCDAKPNCSGETARSIPGRNQESSSSWQLSGCFDCSQVRYRDGVGKHVKICVPAMFMGNFLPFTSFSVIWLTRRKMTNYMLRLFGVQISDAQRLFFFQNVYSPTLNGTTRVVHVLSHCPYRFIGS